MSSINENNVREFIRKLTSGRCITVDDLIKALMERYGIDIHEASWILFKEWVRGRVRFSSRMDSLFFLTIDSMGYWILTALLILAPVVINLSNPILLPVRVIVGVLAYVFLPGYSILMLIYPVNNPLKPVEIMLASIAVSLSIMGLIALFFSLITPAPLMNYIEPISLIMSTMTITFLTIAYIKRSKALSLSPCHRYE